MDNRTTQRRGYPLTIPDALLNSSDMRRACATQNFGEIFRLVNRRTGSSYAVMAAAIGKMTSSRIGDVIRGERRIRGQEVIERVADGFGIPGAMLSLPSRPWERGAPEDRECGEAPPYTAGCREQSDRTFFPGEEIAPPSDVLLASVLVEGRRQIVALSRRELLAGTAGVTVRTGSIHEPVKDYASSTPAPLPHLDCARIEAAMEHLKEMWHALVKADNLFGPRHALASVQQQLSIIGTLLKVARGDQRLEVLRLAAQYAESASWLHEDSADLSSATTWASRATEWATEAGDQSMVSWILFRRSQQATTIRDAAQTIGLAQGALRNDAVLTAPMRAAAMHQEAHGYALDGEKIRCHRRLDEAHKFAASPDTTGDARSGHGDFCTPGYVEIGRGNCWLILSRPDLAAPALQGALSDLPSVYQRDRGFTQACLAMAYVEMREYEEAATHAASALGTAHSSGSFRTLNQTVYAVNALAAVHSSPVVSDLFDAIIEAAEP